MTDPIAVSRRGVMALAGTAAAAAVLPASAAAAAIPAQPADARPEPARFYPFKIGSLDAWSFNDGGGEFGPVHPTFAPEAKPEEVQAVLRDALEPTDKLRFYFNILLVRAGKELVLFDTGNGGDARLLPAMRAAGLSPAQVTAIIISHAHGDHINGLTDPTGVPIFPDARVFISKAEHDFWTAANPDLASLRMPEDRKKGMVANAQKVLAAVKNKIEIVKPGDKILDAIELLDGSGHTPGHMPAIVRDGNDQLVAMADMAHNHVIMFAKPEWTVIFDADPKAAVVARKRLFDRFAADRVRLLGYHMPWPGLGRIGKHADSFWWQIEPWAA